MVKWQEQYAERGLVVIEITGGEQESLEVMKKRVEEQALKYPVLWDKNCRNHRNYGLKNWPVAYLVGSDGTVFWEGNPARVVSRPDQIKVLKEKIEAQLPTAGQNAK